MTTMVGMQSDFAKALQELVELEYDAVEAYEAAINRLNNTDYKQKLEEFKADHLQHIRNLSSLLTAHNQDVPTGPSAVKQWLAKGKVVLADMVGDKTILMAMASNEVDTNIAYDRMISRDDLWKEATDIMQRHFEDEKRHKAWLEINSKE